MQFSREYGAADRLKARRMALNEEDERTVSDLLIDQVEFADVIVLNKADLVRKADLRKLRSLVRALNQNASVVEAIHGRVPPASLLNTRCFDFAKASQAPGWLKVLNGEELSQSGGGGIGQDSGGSRGESAWHY